jgi:diguanylate cyclase (GGDEF)-like protein/PAS domain S-box-containing protein
MNPAWATAGALAAAAGTALLWRSSSQHEPSVKRAYRWLAAVAALWGAGLIAQDAFGGPLTGTAIPLSPADLLALLALPVLVVGVAMLAAGAAGGAAPPESQARGVLARLADGCLLAAALFIVGWLALFAGEYAKAGVGAWTFALDLIRPVADLIALGALLPFAVRAGWRGLAPSLALLAAACGDALAVGARVSGMNVGGWPVLAWIAGICLLAAAPLARPAPLERGRRAGYRPDRTASEGRERAPFGAAAVAATAAAVAALVTIGWALVGGSAFGPVLAAAGAIAVLSLVAQVTGLLRRVNTVSGISTESGRQFRELADRTSDVVLVCDRDGTIRYASPGVAEYGYAPEQLDGMALAELVHPEDRLSGTRVAVGVADGARRLAGRFDCRVRSADGTWRHVESTISRYREPGAADRLLVTARDISDQVALRRQVTHLTFHDGLTGLPNRAYLEERAKSLLSHGPRDPGRLAEAGAIFLDLDGFTAVNDSVGHGAGDLLLAQAARRLRAVVPPQDTVARWGSDEFAILIESAESAQEVVDIAEKLAGSIAAEPFRVAEKDISLTASIGVALADGEASQHLLRNSDVAMSRAKESGGGRVEVFAAHMHTDVVRRIELATGLRQAIADAQLGIEYQPVVELATSRATAVEALVRWSRGTAAVPPAEFLGVAEDSGLIVPLGDWVLREACRQVVAWRAAGFQIGLSVNFSLRQVSASRFTESVLAVLRDSGLPPGALTLEVTERVLIEGAEPMVAGLAELRRRGVRLAIDDFGTGYASLAYLRQLPVDSIKIDPSFVAGLGTDATLAMLTRTIVQVGHDLGIEVVAEGIERPDQLELLREMGCGLGQGYLVARPMTASGIEAFARLAERGGPVSPGPAVAAAAVPGPAVSVPAVSVPSVPVAAVPVAEPAAPVAGVPASAPAS